MSRLKPIDVVPGYEIAQKLQTAEWFVLYRARRIADGAPALLKVSLGAIESRTQLLEKEFRILKQLPVDGVPRAIELIRLDGELCLVFEDSGALPLRTVLSSGKLDLSLFLSIAIRLSSILAEVHRRGVTHRNVNPESILVGREPVAAQLVDFSLASRASERESLPDQLRNQALQYISPEQTGRMNRETDYRTDLYSLGVVFYEMLTGVSPFRAQDRLEIIHGHIAKTPEAPADIQKDIPRPLSDIVVKLLSKSAEQRYQSALGLRQDLEICQREWTTKNRITPFFLAQSDVPDQFVISQQLYGRYREVEQLTSVFEAVCEGSASMMLVSGYAGIGKTSLIQELYRPIVRQRGYFITGKFDQIARSTPFGGLIQAFRGLIQQLLTESEERLTQWRASLSEALNVNGGVIAEVIPEIELILGKQPPVPALAPTEAQNRFRLVFQKFVQAIARRDHPLVMFLDDLQWVDSATLSLFQTLLANPDVDYLFLIGAYRDNEVNETHSLTRSFRTLEGEGVRLHRMSLGPLGLSDLSLLIRDTLRCNLSEAEPLARLTSEKTGGNPFFVIQFLKALWRDRLISFDYEKRHWTFQINAIANAGMTDNVIELMTGKIKRLSAKAQNAITLGACIGNQFDLSTLALVSQQLVEDAASDLAEAVDEGLILPITNHGLTKSELPTYSFLHDRVQQAAYALIPEADKKYVHLKVGRLLLESSDDENLFDVAHHLNVGRDLIASVDERIELARINLSVGRRAKSSTAYESALEYFEAGLSLVTEKQWHTDYDLSIDLHLEAAECLYLCGNFETAEARFDALVTRAKTNLDKARVYRLRSVQYENLSRYEDALATARASLALFGVSFPDSAAEKQAALDIEVSRIDQLLDGRPISSLVNLQVMTDPEIRTVMNTLTDIWSSAYILGDPVLARLISATMVRLSLEHGNIEESAYGYVTHAITVGPVLGDYKAAHEFGLLALKINERFNDSRRRAKIHQQFHAHVNLWSRPMQTCISHAREACRSGLETGDFLYAAYGASTESWPALPASRDLASFVQDQSPNLALITRLKITGFADALRVMLNWVRALQGETRSPLALSNDDFDEISYINSYRDNAFFTTFYAVARLHLCYLFEEHVEALKAARLARSVVYHLSGTIWPVWFELWSGLTLAANYTYASGSDEQRAFLSEIENANKTFAALAKNCPENFLCHSLILSAELERIRGRTLPALDLYEEALNYAREISSPQQQALASEVYGRFWLSRGNERIATAFLAEARSCYAKWGARAKVESLDRKYADLLNRYLALAGSLSQGSTVSGPEDLDVATAMKAAQAMAREIELEKLLARLMSIAIENAGAERGCLILERNGQTYVQAEGTAAGAHVRINDALPLDEATTLSKGIVNYVRRTLESVVLADARADDRYAADAYVLRKQPRSILCTPVLKQGQLVGVLYLENNLIPEAFTTERIQLMQLLSSEAAISIENARLYDEMKQEAAHRRQAEQTLRAIVEGTAAVTGGDFFSALVAHLAEAIGVRYAFVTECTDQTKSRVRTLAFWSADSLADNIEYDLEGTPCQSVIAGQICHHPGNLQRRFPEDKALATLGAESFIGLPMCDADGGVIGHLAVLDDAPLPDASRAMSLLTIFAGRAGAELQRLKAEQGLRQALAQVEQLKNRLHAENIYLQEEIRREHNFEEIVGNSPALLELLADVERVAPTNSTVLINGETGTGKELIARAIHDRSARKKRPLVKVNCGAISAGLVESELFGHVKGAFTGAIDRRVGRFELADGGTLFLDEVSELPFDTQVKLLRVLQEGEFEAVGSSKTVRVDVRIIAASNRDLSHAVQQEKFRSDLFYRLNVFPLKMPPLRERASDIPQLTMFFLSQFSKKLGKKIDSVSQETMDLLVNYSWPGNVRELQNIIERGVVLAQGGVLKLDRSLVPAFSGTVSPIVNQGKTTSGDQTLEQIEREHIQSVLDQVGWVIEGSKGAARILKLHPNTLRSRMKKLRLSRPVHDIS